MRALHKTIETEKMSLINGMPGTGKTTTLALLIYILWACGKKVVVCS
jgi:signal recognition particle GTPase